MQGLLEPKNSRNETLQDRPLSDAECIELFVQVHGAEKLLALWRQMGILPAE
jgi:hypothetical protein